MFYYDRGLFLTKAALAVDVRRRHPRGFISHAHADHIAPHELALCTPATALLYQHRLGPRATLELPYREPVEFGGLRLTTYPAGHVLGSAMLLAEDGAQSLLYTGDFKLGESATAERADPPHADILVIESTYGDPRFRLPPRDEVLERLFALIHQAIAVGTTPVIHAYVLGKAQEITRLLSDRQIPVLQHPLVYELSRVYEQAGCRLGRYAVWDGEALPGHAVIAPPRGQKAAPLHGLGRTVHIATTGWAVDEAARFRLGVDHALPLSDHADYDQLLATIEQVQPREIFCTHGPGSFVDRLQEAGYPAFPLERPGQFRRF